MHQEPNDILPKPDLPASSPCSIAMTHHPSTSTDSLSSLEPSSSSYSSEDTYETSSPVNETDEIVLRTYCHDNPENTKYGGREDTSLWADLDRDGIETAAIPSFILNSPPMGPVSENAEYVGLDLGSEHRVHAIHSLRKGMLLPLQMLTAGCDPKFFFGESVDPGNVTAEARTFTDVDPAQSDPADLFYSFLSRGYPPEAPTSNPRWTGDDVSAYKYLPIQGAWGIIPSRTVMITNLPKTTQLWTLVELLKVSCFRRKFEYRDLAIGRGSLRR